MSEAALEHVLRRDRAIVIAALAALTALAWAYTIWLANSMDMGGMGMPKPPGMGMPTAVESNRVADSSAR